MDVKKVAELLKDEEFVEKIFTTATQGELQALFEENGVFLKEQELKGLINSIQAKLEESVSLSEADLKIISGGSDMGNIKMSMPESISPEKIHNFLNNVNFQN